jgi:chromosome segregation ATPase
MGVQKEDVGVIIANVRNTLKNGKTSYNNFFRTITTHCASGVARINSTIKGLQNLINDALSNTNSWNKNLASATKDRKDAQANIVKGRGQLAGLRKTRAKKIMDYKVYAAEADKKLMVVKTLRDIITDELFNRTPGALVQVNKFQQKLAELKGLLNNNSDSLYAPMISVLLDLATEQNFSDQAVLRKILQNLNNLDKSLQAFRANQEKTLTSEMKSIRGQIKNVKSRIRAYRRMRQQASSKVIDAQHYISFYKHEFDHFTAEKNRMTDELHLFEKLCAFEKKVHHSGARAFHTMKAQIVPYLFSAVQRLKQ